MRLRRAAAIAAAAVVATVLAACDGGGDTSNAGSSQVSQTGETTSVSSAAAGLQEQFVDTIDAVGPSVVQVQTAQGLGSGIVLDGNGNIVTNNHVVGSFTRFRVTASSGKRFAATLVGTFPPDDLAVIHVDGANLPPAELGDSSKLQLGDLVLAVGSPLGLQSSVTNGIVSALGRTVSEQNGVALPDLIQTSAAINPGNSGGALVNLEGQVVGIPTLAAIDPENNQQAIGIGFAIPSNTVKAIAGQLISHGTVVRSNRAFLGVRLETISSGGVRVVAVTPNGPAAAAGIEAGDTITAIDGRPVRSIDDIAVVLADRRPGQKIDVTLRQPQGGTETVTLTLGELPGS